MRLVGVEGEPGGLAELLPRFGEGILEVDRGGIGGWGKRS